MICPPKILAPGVATIGRGVLSLVHQQPAGQSGLLVLVLTIGGVDAPIANRFHNLAPALKATSTAKRAIFLPVCWYQPIPESVLRRHLKLLHKIGEPFEFDDACVSYALDLRSDRVGSERSYAKAWRWSPATTHRQLPKIRAAVEEWATFGRSKDEAVVKHGRSSNEARNALSVNNKGETRSNDEAVVKQGRSSNEAHLIEIEIENRDKILIPLPLFPVELDTPGFRTAWQEWLADRKARRIKPYTDRGQAAQLKNLATIGPAQAIACINQSIANGWTGLFPDRFKNPNQTNPHEPKSVREQAAELMLAYTSASDNAGRNSNPNTYAVG